MTPLSWWASLAFRDDREAFYIRASEANMKAVTVCQPYAELIARGDKVIENRTWPTSYRGPLLIHAGKSRDWLDDEDEYLMPNMAFGAVVATARLVACLDLRVKWWPPQWRHLRDNEHANGPWCWILEDVKRLPQPVSMRGAQGLWEASV